MKVILDTNVILWFLADDEKLPDEHKQIIENLENEIYISVVSLWEIVIKLNIGKLKINMDFKSFFDVISNSYEFNVLHINEKHLFQYLKLPLIHRDPFDRLIYSQAVTENMDFLFTDEVFNSYQKMNMSEKRLITP